MFTRMDAGASYELWLLASHAPPRPRCQGNEGLVNATVSLMEKVTDPARPYARFYLLETIARVPYFCALRGRWGVCVLLL